MRLFADDLVQGIHHEIEFRPADNKRRRNQNMIAPLAINGSAHRIDQQPVRHALRFDSRMQLQQRIECRFALFIAYQLHAGEQTATARITDIR